MLAFRLLRRLCLKKNCFASDDDDDDDDDVAMKLGNFTKIYQHNRIVVKIVQ
jgi:hypothetical protein